MSSLRSCLIVMIIWGFVSAPVSAQRYARDVADTLHYDESTKVHVEIMTPGGVFPVDVIHDAGLAITHVARDTVRAWYERLVVSSESPAGNQRPNTSEVVGVPFTLLFSERGEVQTLESPPVPAPLRVMSDVRRQFHDFFLILPENTLVRGFSWSYEVAVEDSIDSSNQNAFRKVGQLTVEGDTVVSGISGLKIVGELNSTLSSSQYVPEQGAVVRNAFSGIERNVFVWAPDSGTLLYRMRAADLDGETVIDGGAAPMKMNQRIRYDSEFRLRD